MIREKIFDFVGVIAFVLLIVGAAAAKNSQGDLLRLVGAVTSQTAFLGESDRGLSSFISDRRDTPTSPPHSAGGSFFSASTRRGEQERNDDGETKNGVADGGVTSDRLAEVPHSIRQRRAAGAGEGVQASGQATGGLGRSGTRRLPAGHPSGRADADGGHPVPVEEWDEETHLRLAQACKGEGGFESLIDCSMTAFVLVRRWRITSRRLGWSFRKTIERYTMLKNKGPRPDWVRALPLGPLTGDDRPLSRIWLRLLDHVGDWYAGDIEDPCPEADHWSGRHPTPRAIANVAKGGWRTLDCGTLNIPYDDPRLKLKPLEVYP